VNFRFFIINSGQMWNDKTAKFPAHLPKKDEPQSGKKKKCQKPYHKRSLCVEKFFNHYEIYRIKKQAAHRIRQTAFPLPSDWQ
jgi:hypothetical protein